jgi:hypothetical protein
MKPIEFKEQTKILRKPASMTDEECSSMAVYSDDKICVSCWKSTKFIERLYFLFTGRIWLGVLSGGTQPPVWVTPTKPFIKWWQKDQYGFPIEKTEGHPIKDMMRVTGLNLKKLSMTNVLNFYKEDK